MTRVLDVLRGLAAAMLGALLGAALLVIAYAWGPDLTVAMDIDPPSIVRGLYPVERTPDGLTFAWSRDQVSVMLPGLDRQHAWQFKLRFATPRPVPPASVSSAGGAPATLPDVTFVVDGVNLKTVRGTHNFQDVTITLPMVTGETRGAAIIVRVGDTFVPGLDDPRQIGMMVDELRIVRPAQGVPIIPRQAIAAAAVGGAIFGGLFGLIGLTAGSATLAVTALGIGQAVVVARGAAPYTRYIRDIPEIAGYVAVGTVILVWIVERVRNQRLRNTARFVAAFSAAALFLKLLVLLHPHMPIGDALFQAHRFEWVRDGKWFFTSIAPGGYQFPYAIGLYVAALPFDEYVRGTFGFMALLRILVAVMDTAAGVVLYPLIVGSLSDAVDPAERPQGIAGPGRSPDIRLAGAVAVGLFHLLPLNFQVQTVGNLTNAFGQSLFAIALALIVLIPRQTAPLVAGAPMRYAAWAGLVVVTSFAMMSHTSTFAIAIPVMLLAGVLLWMFGATSEERTRGRAVLVVTAIAALVAVVLYYRHFGEVYASMFARITGEMGKPAELSDPGGRSIAQRVLIVPYYLNEYYGWPALVLAGIGAGMLARRRDTLTLVVWAWVAGTFAFLLLGVFTPLDFRHYLAAFPAVALLAGCGAARWWTKGPFLQAAAIVLLGSSVLIGVRHWLAALR
jgi:hypothetical protein